MGTAAAVVEEEGVLVADVAAATAVVVLEVGILVEAVPCCASKVLASLYQFNKKRKRR